MQIFNKNNFILILRTDVDTLENFLDAVDKHLSVGSRKLVNMVVDVKSGIPFATAVISK